MKCRRHSSSRAKVRRSTRSEVMAFVAGRVAPHMQLRACELIDVIPKSPSGKLLRRVLVEREREAQR